MKENKIAIPTGMDQIFNVATKYRKLEPDEVLGMQVDPSGGTSRKKVRASAILYTDKLGNEMIVYDEDEPDEDDFDEDDEESPEESVR